MTIKDIARESGYAVGTVSRVINHNPNVSDAARARILEVIEKYHFQPNANAKHLKQQANQGIAMIVKGTHNMLFASVLEKMQAECSAAGYSSMVFYIDENDNEVEQARCVCRERKPYGVIFLGSDRNHFGPDLADLGVPCLLMTNTAATAAIPNLSSVSVDDVAAAVRMVGHLLDNGHRRIAFIGGDLTSSQPSSARLSGCLSEFSRRGLSFDPAGQYIEARYTLVGGYHAMEQLLDNLPGLTAVFAFSDIMAIGAIRALRDRGLRVPEDVSVCGFDGIELADYLSPRLTTIRQPAERMAGCGVSILIRCIEEGCDAVHELVPYELLEGESIQRLPDPNKIH
ncbi:LacI family DNA-binding transcriptional regulator [Subdoligranulum variabile]|uniref:Transcriptional regulator, LacI family n=1 Tax=Subdoligranulum variabile DSM 15176 TaxID=411471 RepID=D1PSI0_9FIRM|nr:LacI family DNA-binding transcriptional regulator [Subdoligranulum variabile]EFB74360.1 transcriptional regulator, LacI family [Subdoligranulum variabile DSM 15176]UWP69314.1 LacI family transcriptional regulator [Subdoligranulum variabile]